MHHTTVPERAPAEIRVMLVDDQPLVRSGLRTLLELEPDIRVVAEAGDGLTALEATARTPVDVALVDAQMPRMDGIELIVQLAQRRPRLPCLVLTTFDDDDILSRALHAGARGHLLKDVEPEELVGAVRLIHTGRTVLGGMAADYLLSEFLRRGRVPDRSAIDLSALSAREALVARHVGEGLTNREIARTLFITEGTVKNHVSSILRKTRMRDRTAVAIALHAASPGRRADRPHV